MNKNNSQKAFTLPEVVVTLSVTVVILALVTSLVIIVSNVSKVQTYNQTCQTEYQIACSLVDEFVNTYSTIEYQLNVTQTEDVCEIAFENGGQTYKLSYQKNERILNAQILNFITTETQQKSISFENITNIVFTKQYNLIKCQYYFENYPTFTNLVVFGAD